jgi:hypothetical protein
MRGTIQTSKRKQAEDIGKETEQYLADGGVVYQAEPGESADWGRYRAHIEALSANGYRQARIRFGKKKQFNKHM